MSAPIGYYVHHHGEGHRQRAAAIARVMPGRLTLIGTGVAALDGPFDVLDLPDDRLDGGGFDGLDGGADRPAALHYAPVAHDGVRARMSAVARWIAEARPALMVVDVSVEIAMLARLCATPTVYVRLAGERWDPAHLDAFRGARAILAPFDPRCESPDAPQWVREKTVHAAGLGVAPEPAREAGDGVLVAFGRGGARATEEALAAAARATPDWRWRAIGPLEPQASSPANLEIAGWVEGAANEIARAAIVVGGAGDGVLGAVAAAARRFVCVPEDRPFHEQRAKAQALERAQAAVVAASWPAAREWPRVLEAARGLDPGRIATFHDPGGVAKAASLLLQAADR